MYTVRNFKSGKELKAAFAAGDRLEVFQPGPFGGGPIKDGRECIEGPHYPQPHKFYIGVDVKDGVIVKIHK